MADQPPVRDQEPSGRRDAPAWRLDRRDLHPHGARPARHRSAGSLVVVGLVVLPAAVALTFWGLSTWSYEVAGALLVGLVLVAVHAPLIARAAAGIPGPGIGPLLLAGFLLRLATAVVRFVGEPVVYGHRADAGMYARDGMQIAQSISAGTFDAAGLLDLRGTAFVRTATGLLMSAIGPTTLGAFLVFAALGFWGAFGFVKAYHVVFPAAPVRRYALLVLLLPSLVFWPTVIGKDAWMAASLGAAAYGMALLIRGRAGGFAWFGAGLLAAFVVRPHVAALMVAAATAALLHRGRRRDVLTGVGLAIRTAALVLVVVAMGAVVNGAEDYFGLESDATSTNIDELLGRTAQNTARGGSEVEASPADSLRDLPRGLVTVLLRPFPFEAHNAQALVSSLEGLLLLGLMVRRLPVLRRLPALVVRDAYVRYVVVFAMMFVFAWSSIGNFGILVRQRTQLLPHVVVLLAIPAASAIRDPVPLVAARPEPG